MLRVLGPRIPFLRRPPTTPPSRAKIDNRSEGPERRFHERTRLFADSRLQVARPNQEGSWLPHLEINRQSTNARTRTLIGSLRPARTPIDGVRAGRSVVACVRLSGPSTAQHRRFRLEKRARSSIRSYTKHQNQQGLDREQRRIQLQKSRVRPRSPICHLLRGQIQQPGSVRNSV